MKTCKLRPSASECRRCIDIEETLNCTVMCQRCRYNTKRYEILGFEKGVFAVYALINMDGCVKAVNIDRIHDLREDTQK